MPHDLSARVRNMRPDPPDLRDRLYSPTLSTLRPSFRDKPWADGRYTERVRDQGDSQACTGFALAALAEGLLLEQWTRDHQEGDPPPALSPWMLYYFARRYDEFPGEDPEQGSSARAAMKAWNNHGSCLDELWRWKGVDPERLSAAGGGRSGNNTDEDPHAAVSGGSLEVQGPGDAPPASTGFHPPTGGEAWVSDGFRRPLGAYFRIDQCEIRDLHAALNEIGFAYVTAQIHSGWSEPDAVTGEIPYTGGEESLGGHAFLLVGYDEKGFWIQNSWGPGWGKEGFARLTYGDWRANAMDAWVAQIGVQISSFQAELHQGLSFEGVRGLGDAELEQDAVGFRLLSSSRKVRNQQINPYVVNLGNEGFLSDRGEFRTSDVDLDQMVGYYLNTALDQWGVAADQPIDVALYAHGGLTPEGAAADTAARWIPELFARRIFPIFFMWETGLLDTWRDIREDRDRLGVGAEGAAGVSLWDRFKTWQDERVEILAASKLFDLWAQMKQNAQAASEPRRPGDNDDRGIAKLYNRLARLDAGLRNRLRFHLVGHSAGAVFHAHLLPRMIEGGLRVDGLYLMAPACTVDLFQNKIVPHLQSGAVPTYTQYHLSDEVERKDTCAVPVVNVPAYRKSLLYLVSNGFERPRGTPILGMERFFKGLPAPAGVTDWTVVTSPTSPLPVDPGLGSTSTSHGGFDNDRPTMVSVAARISRRARLPLAGN
jgi:hypothetical protein